MALGPQLLALQRSTVSRRIPPPTPEQLAERRARVMVICANGHPRRNAARLAIRADGSLQVQHRDGREREERELIEVQCADRQCRTGMKASESVLLSAVAALLAADVHEIELVALRRGLRIRA